MKTISQRGNGTNKNLSESNCLACMENQKKSCVSGRYVLIVGMSFNVKLGNSGYIMQTTGIT